MAPSPWLVALCAVRFDLEQGQVMDHCLPPDRLTDRERSHVALCAFPDSHHSRLHSSFSSSSSQRTVIHDSIFFFRIPAASVGAAKDLFGYVFHRQRQDDRLIRGSDQQSVVILSNLPYWTSIFKPLVQIAGPLFFDAGIAALERISSTISSSWPAPPPNPGLDLPVDRNLAIRVAANLAPPPQPDQGTLFLGVDLFAVLKGVLMQLWLLWELVLIGEPLLVAAPSPSIACEAVAAISSLIAPVPCSVDLRPYFTIHDPDFHIDLVASSITTSSSKSTDSSITTSDSIKPTNSSTIESTSSIILGVTNLFFCRAFSSSRRLPSVLSLLDSNLHHHQFQQLKKFVDKKPWSSLSWSQRRRGSQGLWSGVPGATKPDTAVLNRLVDAVPSSPRMDESVSLVNSDILRRHFVELTTNFLAPLTPYFTVAANCEINPFVDPPPLPEFDQEQFVAALASRGPGKFLAKRLGSNWIDLYRGFIRGPNFEPWFRSKRSGAEREQRRIWRQARSKADVRAIVAKMPELQLVDMFNAVLRHVVSELEIKALSSQGFKNHVLDKLCTDLRLVFDMLPRDTQQLLLLNPQHASLLLLDHSRASSRSSSNTTKLPGRPSIHISWSSEGVLSLSRRNSPLALSGRLELELASDPLNLEP